jgi:formylglycine-generating enzyme required for sulfatase activity
VWAVVLFLAMLFPVSSFAMQGDLDDDDAVGISDAILSLKILAGQTGLDLSEKDDVDGDGVFGLAEAIYALRRAAMPAEGGTARAVLGPLAGAAVRVYRLNDLETPVYEITTDGDGYFDTGATGANPSEYVLVAVSGGMDTDADDDGIPDAVPTPNAGTIHALMTAYRFASGGFQVTALSDIAWRYTENLVGEVDGSGLKIRLDDLAGNFFVSDLNGDGEIDAGDLLAFLPAVQAHQDALNFDYGILFAENEDGHSIVGAYHDDLTDVLPALLEETFWSRLSLVPGTDLRYDKIQIEVAAFGRGSVTSDMGGISIDSERADLSENVSKAFLDRNETDQMTLTATPTSETEILSWRGCDAVSEDMTRCEVGLRTDRLVSVSFGYEEALLKSGVTLVDLSGATVTASADQVTLEATAGVGDTEMIARLAGISAGDVVVGDRGGGFLRKVVSVQKVSDDNYILTTEDATLEEVVAQGTGVFSKQMTHGDLAETTRSGLRSGRASGGFESLPGVRLIPSDRNDTVFSIEIGDPRERASLGLEDTLKWIDPDSGIAVEAKGTVEVSIEVDTGVSFGLFSGLEYFKFVPEVSATESLDISIGGEVETPKDAFQKEIGTLRFTKISFFVGPVPVWIEPQVKIILGFTAKAGGEVSTGITLKQTVRGGVVYNKGAGADMVGEFTPSYELKPPAAQFYAEAKPFVKTQPVMYIYSVTGPAIDLEAYLRFRGEVSAAVFSDDPCDGGLSFAAYAGIAAGFEWDMGKAKKLGDWASQVTLSGTLFDEEILLREWNVDGVCDSLPPFLELTGLDMDETATLGAGGVVSKIYGIRNAGDETLDWRVSFLEDAAISVSPSSGSLAGDGTAEVTVSVDTAVLEAGRYSNVLEFRNESGGGLLDGRPDGSAERAVTVRVTPPPLASPILAQPEMATDGEGNVAPSRVILSWTYPDAATLDWVDGYTVWLSTDPDAADSWRQVAVNVRTTTYEVSNLLPNTTYWFAADAYGTDVEPGLSEIVSITTPTAQTGGDTVTDSSGLGMTFVRIPAGAFMMGSPTDEPGRYSDETEHHVTLTQDYYIMTAEVTQAQWEAVMGSNPSFFNTCGGDCPVESVSWNDIQDFIAAFNAMEGKAYRLPTEAEWEYAVRAGTTTAFYNGGITNTGCTPLDPNLDQIGWYCGNSTVDYTPNYKGKGTHPVGQNGGKQPNDYGLYDMSGSVWEWCQDWYGSYPDSTVTDPAGADTGSWRVFRGGWWGGDARHCRSARRSVSYPSNRDYHIGFRLARSPGQ